MYNTEVAVGAIPASGGAKNSGVAYCAVDYAGTSTVILEPLPG
jgi:hypothetical protein